MKIKGTIYNVLPQQSGTGKNGKDWKKSEFILETTDQYPKKIKVSIMKPELIDQFGKLHGGDTIEVSFNLESREYNTKWYTEVTAWKIELKGSEPLKGDSLNDPASNTDEDLSELPF